MKLRQQSGFTLVEIAIVLVIIGLLLGGILKGQELIENSRVTNAVNDINGLKAAYNAYLDRYRRIPGDDNTFASPLRGSEWTGVTAGGGNGVLNITAGQTFNGAGEGTAFFQQLRASGFISGDKTQTGAAVIPTNSWGGRTGVTNAAVQGLTAATKLVCVSNVPGKAAIAIDNRLDDGLSGRGSVRATQGANVTNPGAAAANYSEDQVYTVCAQL